MTPMKWFYSFLKKYRWRMFWGIVLTTIVAACALVSPYVSKLIVDRVIQHEQYGMLKNLIIVLIVTIIIRGICRFFSQVLFETSSQNVLYSMRDTVYRKLLQEDFAFYNKNRIRLHINIIKIPCKMEKSIPIEAALSACSFFFAPRK